MDGPGYHSQAVSNAVLAVIAATDALCLFRIGERAEGDSARRGCRRAPRGPARARPLRQRPLRRAQQLADVLEQKSPSQYYGKQITPDTAERVMKQAERFIKWVRETLPQPEPEQPLVDE